MASDISSRLGALSGLTLKSGEEINEAKNDTTADKPAVGLDVGLEKPTGEEKKGPNLQIQFCSDLHIEGRPGKPAKLPPVNAPVLALLGDIGLAGTKAYAAFLRSLCEKFETVLVLAGNHEYYGGEYEERKCEIRKLAEILPNMHFLDCSSMCLGGVKILGCTLWSQVPPSARTMVESTLNDYEMIKMLNVDTEVFELLTVTDTNMLHREEATFLWREITKARAEGETVLVLTHHAPLLRGTSYPQFNGLPTNHAFATDLSELMGSPVAAWLYGHTHFNPRDLVVDGTRVLANQKGYSNDRTGVPFDPGLVLHLEGGMEVSVEHGKLKRG